jgi:hypothetical protein
MKSRVLDKLDKMLNDEILSPEQREKACFMRDEIERVYEKRAVMRRCPGLCLMEIARAAKKSDRALELAFRYTNRAFWNEEAFCREALKITPEALEWIPEKRHLPKAEQEGADFLNKNKIFFSHEFCLNPAWLRDGRGEMFTPPALGLTSRDTATVAKYRLLTLDEQAVIDAMMDALLKK